jgi:hypothetical protein
VTDPADGTSGQRTGRAALSRDLSDFLVELSIALHKHAMYPEGHPSLAPAADRVLQRLDPLLVERGSLSLGVARDQLVIEGVATDSKNPVLADLAGRLHRHHLGAITFRRGVDPIQLHDVLTTVAEEADRTHRPLGLRTASDLNRWSGITLHPVSYDSLELLEEAPDGEQDAVSREARSQAAALWVGLARAAMATEEADENEPLPNAEPAVVAKAIDERGGDTAYDQVIVGYLLKIADELRTSRGNEAIALRNRMSKLVSQLDKGTVGRLLQMGGDRAQRRRFILNASEGMAVDAVLELVKAAGDEEQTVSHSMLRMLQKLAQHAETGVGERGILADSAMREQVVDLIKGWSLKDPNPDGYGLALQQASSTGPIFSVAPQAKFAPEPRRMFEMALEVDEIGEAVKRAVDDLVESGNLRMVVTVLHESRATKVPDVLWEHLGTKERLEWILAAEPIDVEVLDRVLLRVGSDAVEPMLDTLRESDSTQTRRVVIDRLARYGMELAPAILARLNDPRWYVQRNMLALLAQLPEVPADFKAAEFLQHKDARVRRHVVELALRMPTTYERAVCAALADSDIRIVRMGLVAALQDCPEAALPIVVQRALGGDMEELRLAAIRVLGKSSRRSAIDTLIRMVAPRRKLLRWSLPAKSKVFLAALRALRPHGRDPRVKQVLDIAMRTGDADVVQAASGAEEQD